MGRQGPGPSQAHKRRRLYLIKIRKGTTLGVDGVRRMICWLRYDKALTNAHIANRHLSACLVETIVDDDFGFS